MAQSVANSIAAIDRKNEAPSLNGLVTWPLLADLINDHRQQFIDLCKDIPVEADAVEEMMNRKPVMA